MRHPQTYSVNLNTVLQNKRDALGVNSLHIDLDLASRPSWKYRSRSIFRSSASD